MQQSKEIGDTSERLRAANGAFYGSPSSFPSEKDLAAYSRDPRMLLNGIYLKTLGAGQSIDGEALARIADLLRTGLVPADFTCGAVQGSSTHSRGIGDRRPSSIGRPKQGRNRPR